jgi:hypothetical protein
MKVRKRFRWQFPKRGPAQGQIAKTTCNEILPRFAAFLNEANIGERDGQRKMRNKVRNDFSAASGVNLESGTESSVEGLFANSLSGIPPGCKDLGNS